jgi:hypothetical protein
MISRNIKDGNLDELIDRFTELLIENGFTVSQPIDMLEKKMPVPRVVVMGAKKDEMSFRVSFVFDKNGITITVPVKDKKVKSTIEQLLDLLLK